MMAGYCEDYSMSVNAEHAYAEGLCPASRTGVPAELVRRFCVPVEWHHTSARYNRTEFYDRHAVRVTFGLEPEDGEHKVDQEAVEALALKPALDTRIYTGCSVEWVEWVGRFANHQRPITHKAGPCTVAVRGQTATITLSDGQTFRKRLGTRGLRITHGQEVFG